MHKTKVAGIKVTMKRWRKGRGPKKETAVLVLGEAEERWWRQKCWGIEKEGSLGRE